MSATRVDLLPPVEPNEKAIAKALTDLEADVTRFRLPWQSLEVPDVSNGGLKALEGSERTLRFMGLGAQADQARNIRNAAVKMISIDIYNPAFGCSSGGGYRTGD